MRLEVMSDDGRILPRGERGEIVLRGGLVMAGYYKNPHATEEASAFGWHHTGDIGVIDEDGFVYIVDRWKDMYISGGENVYPAEVENVLYQLGAIAEAAVIAIADPRWGEVGRAVVVRKPGATLSESEVIAHCIANLARYKLPQSVVFTEALPRNATGKVHKPTLRQQFGLAG